MIIKRNYLYRDEKSNNVWADIPGDIIDVAAKAYVAEHSEGAA